MTDVPRRLLLVPGSLDPTDGTTATLAATTILAGPFAELRWADLAPLPLFDTTTFPDVAVGRFWDDIAWADAVLLGIPDHHGDISARAKNAVDWALAGSHPFGGHPVGLVVKGADGRVLRSRLGRAGLHLVDPLLEVPGDDGFSDGLLVDPVALRGLTLLLDALTVRVEAARSEAACAS